VHPGQIAVEKLFDGSTREQGLKAVEGSRHVLAMVTSVIPGRGAFLELEDERFDLRSRELSRIMVRGSSFILHLAPSRPGLWIPGPGWLEWPFFIGPNMRRNLKDFQLDPILVERLLQNRERAPDERPEVEYPRDTTLEEAVARMTKEAKSEGRPALVLSAEEWERLVLKHLDDTDITRFTQEVIRMVSDVESPDEMNRWFALAMNIWNSTPQPDRGGRTAYELSEEREAN